MRKPTNWNDYSSTPDSFLTKHFFLNFVTRAYDNLLKGIKFNKPIKILEFGCGTGYIDLFLAKKFETQKVTGIEFNDKMLKRNLYKKNFLKYIIQNINKKREKGGKKMVRGKPVTNLVNLAAWITGVLVSLAVGFGMIGGILTVPYVQPIVPFAGWVVVILTVVSIVLAIADKV